MPADFDEQFEKALTGGNPLSDKDKFGIAREEVRNFAESILPDIQQWFPDHNMQLGEVDETLMDIRIGDDDIHAVLYVADRSVHLDLDNDNRTLLFADDPYFCHKLRALIDSRLGSDTTSDLELNLFTYQFDVAFPKDLEAVVPCLEESFPNCKFTSYCEEDVPTVICESDNSKRTVWIRVRGFVFEIIGDRDYRQVLTTDPGQLEFMRNAIEHNLQE